MNKLDPKARFMEDSERANEHQEQMLSPAFKDAASAALLNYTMNLGASSLQSAAETALKAKGAQEFLLELLNLGEKTRPQHEPLRDTLKPV